MLYIRFTYYCTDVCTILQTRTFYMRFTDESVNGLQTSGICLQTARICIHTPSLQNLFAGVCRQVRKILKTRYVADVWQPSDWLLQTAHLHPTWPPTGIARPPKCLIMGVFQNNGDSFWMRTHGTQWARAGSESNKSQNWKSPGGISSVSSKMRTGP